MMAHSIVLLRDQISALEKANQAATKRKQRKKKRIQKQGTLTKAEGQEIIAQKEIDQQVECETRQQRVRSGASRQASARCRRCRGTGHNSRTCKKDTIDTN